MAPSKTKAEPVKEPEPVKDQRDTDRAAELAKQAAVEKAVHNLVYFGDGTPRPLP